MKAETIQLLSRITQDFYENHAASFSDTRRNSWAGWEQLLELVKQTQLSTTQGFGEYHVLDLACGNLRFENYLADKLLKDGQTAQASAIHKIFCLASDICMSLSQEFAWCKQHNKLEIVQHECDIQATLLNGKELSAVLPHTQDGFQLMVSFGFMHHLASHALRLKFLESCADMLDTDGILCVSCWSFMHEESLHKKAQAATEHALKLYPQLLEELEEGDYFLGWSQSHEQLRYCHHFNAEEIDRLSTELINSFQQRHPDETLAHIATWQADGKTGKLNYYLAFQRR